MSDVTAMKLCSMETILVFANRLGICNLHSYESVRPKSYVVATQVGLDPCSCFQRKTESEIKWYINIQYFPRNFHHYGESFYIMIKVKKVCHVYHLLLNHA